MIRAVVRFHDTLVGLINDRRLIEVALAGSSELGKSSLLWKPRELPPVSMLFILAGLAKSR